MSTIKTTLREHIEQGERALMQAQIDELTEALRVAQEEVSVQQRLKEVWFLRANDLRKKLDAGNKALAQDEAYWRDDMLNN